MKNVTKQWIEILKLPVKEESYEDLSKTNTIYICTKEQLTVKQMECIEQWGLTDVLYTIMDISGSINFIKPLIKKIIKDITPKQGTTEIYFKDVDSILFRAALCDVFHFHKQTNKNVPDIHFYEWVEESQYFHNTVLYSRDPW